MVKRMKCDNCQNENAHAYKMKISSKGEVNSCCDKCGGKGSISTFHDVYFRSPYWDENFTSEKDPQTWDKGTFITSKSQKARLMKESKMFESGDKVHGARIWDKRRTYI